jgi:hypothetical protein
MTTKFLTCKRVTTDSFSVTNSIEREANSSSAGQEISRVLCNPNVHNPLHKSPSLVHLLFHINPLQDPPAYLFGISFNTTLPSTPRSSTRFLFFRFSYSACECTAFTVTALTQLQPHKAATQPDVQEGRSFVSKLHTFCTASNGRITVHYKTEKALEGEGGGLCECTGYTFYLATTVCHFLQPFRRRCGRSSQ